MPRYEILSEDAMETLDRGWRRIVTELGVEFLLEDSLEEFRKAGQKVEGNNVKLAPEFVLEQVAKAPREFDIRARNPDHAVHIGGDHMVFASVYGPPFVREGDTRRDATMADFENFVKLSQAFDELDSPGGTIVEPNDRPLDSRHLDMVLALQTLSDKPYMGSVTSGPNASDTIRMGEVLFGGRDALETTTASLSIINVNSPLRYDDRMLSAMLEYVRARQAAMITPFLLMGAMSPVAIPATLAELRHARVGDRPAVLGAARAPVRPAVAKRRRRPDVQSDRGRPVGLRGAHDDAPDVPVGGELRDALGRLARGRA